MAEKTKHGDKSGFWQIISRFLNRIFWHPVRHEPSSYVLQRHYNSMGELLPPERRPARPPGYHLNELERAEGLFYARLREERRRLYEAAWEIAMQGSQQGQRAWHRKRSGKRPGQEQEQGQEQEHGHEQEQGQEQGQEQEQEQEQGLELWQGQGQRRRSIGVHLQTPCSDMQDSRMWPGWDVSALQNLYNMFAMYFLRERGLLEEARAAALAEDLGDRTARHERRARFRAADVNLDGGLEFPELLTMLYRADSEVMRQPLSTHERRLLSRLMKHSALESEAATEAEAEALARAANAMEENQRELLPLARSVLEKGRRAEILANMNAQTQISYGFL